MKIIEKQYDLVVGLGEIGNPLLSILSNEYLAIGRDINPVDVNGVIGVLHICYPYEIDDFVGTTVKYIEDYDPQITIIHSTVVPGTTTKIFHQVGGLIAYSPVRGKHAKMHKELLGYTKFVAGTTSAACELARKHLEGAGFRVKIYSSCESLETAKLIETTYFGLLISWAQEVERFCIEIGADYDEVMMITEDINYFPPVVFRPGYIGGHCVIPNTYLLENVRHSPIIDMMRSSNEQKKEEWLREGRDLSERIKPRSINQSHSKLQDPLK